MSTPLPPPPCATMPSRRAFRTWAYGNVRTPAESHSVTVQCLRLGELSADVRKKSLQTGQGKSLSAAEIQYVVPVPIEYPSSSIPSGADGRFRMASQVQTRVTCKNEFTWTFVDVCERRVALRTLGIVAPDGSSTKHWSTKRLCFSLEICRQNVF